MLEQWLNSCPELTLIALDITPGTRDDAAVVAVPAFALRFASSGERALIACLGYIAAGNHAYALEMAQQAQGEARQLPDLYLLCGALLLAEGRIDDAIEPLRSAYEAASGSTGVSAGGKERSGADSGANIGGREPLGLPARRLYPQLRVLLRVSPSQLLPLYPDTYSAALMFAVALQRNGRGSEALDVLRETGAATGYNDEIRLIAAQIFLARGDYDKVAELLAEPEDAQHDALDVTRSIYLALAQLKRGNLRGAVHALRASVLHTKDVNPHTHARARLLLAHVYGAASLPLEALRCSALVAPLELPASTAQWLAAQEKRWIEQLGSLDEVEMEQQAQADCVTLRIPERAEVLQLSVKRIEIVRDPVAELKPSEMSWYKRREEEQQIAGIKAAAARGEQVLIGEPKLSPAARELKHAIARAQKWWETRGPDLRLHGEDALMRDCSQCAQLRFDMRGNRTAPVYNLPCERIWSLIVWAAGISAFIAGALLLLRACTQGL
ncbi:MAG: hypothetical protein M3R04_09005 [bacterium]|nr:hypothetical protein [bacterium]